MPVRLIYRHIRYTPGLQQLLAFNPFTFVTIRLCKGPVVTTSQTDYIKRRAHFNATLTHPPFIIFLFVILFPLRMLLLPLPRMVVMVTRFFTGLPWRIVNRCQPFSQQSIRYLGYSFYFSHFHFLRFLFSWFSFPSPSSSVLTISTTSFFLSFSSTFFSSNCRHQYYHHYLLWVLV